MLTTAQQFYNDIIRPFKVADYKAPHAPRGTPPRKHWQRGFRMIFSKAHNAIIPVRRPFNGHRP